MPLISPNVPRPKLCTSSESTFSSSLGIRVHQTRSLGVSMTPAAHGTQAGGMSSKLLSPLRPHCPHTIIPILGGDQSSSLGIPQGTQRASWAPAPRAPATVLTPPCLASLAIVLSGQRPLSPCCSSSLRHIPCSFPLESVFNIKDVTLRAITAILKSCLYT